MADTVFSVIKSTISIGKAIWKMIDDMKQLDDQRDNLQQQVGVLINIVQGIEEWFKANPMAVSGELQTALGNLQHSIEEVVKACAEFDIENVISTLTKFDEEDEGVFRKLIKKAKQARKLAEITLRAESKETRLLRLDQRLKLALSLVQVAFSITHSKQTQQLGVQLSSGIHHLKFVTDDAFEVYTNPRLGKLPKLVTGVSAEVENQHLIVEWNKGSEGTFESTESYQIRYRETTNDLVTVTADSLVCQRTYPTFKVALGPQRIEPWQEYAIQVRAVNASGASQWSAPPLYIRMNQGPPSPPSTLIVEAKTQNSLKVIIPKIPPKYNEQEVKHVIVEKCTHSRIGWDPPKKEIEVNKSGDTVCTLDDLEVSTRYTIRVRYRNKFAISLPSTEIPIKIEDMIPTQPSQLQLMGFAGKFYVKFKPPSVNPGAVKTYCVQISFTKSSKLVYKSDDINTWATSTLEEVIVHSIDSDVKIDPKNEYDVTVLAKAKNAKTQCKSTQAVHMSDTPIDIVNFCKARSWESYFSIKQASGIVGAGYNNLHVHFEGVQRSIKQLYRVDQETSTDTHVGTVLFGEISEPKLSTTFI